MPKPIYYLWKKDFTSQKEFEITKEKFKKLGFRVVTYMDGQPDNNIHDGLKAVIKNHSDRKASNL